MTPCPAPFKARTGGCSMSDLMALGAGVLLALGTVGLVGLFAKLEESKS